MSRTRSLLAAAAVGALVIVPVACSDDGDDTATTDTVESATGGEATVGDVTIADAWARATTPGTTTSAVYMLLTSTDGDALTGVSVPSSVAGEAQIHQTSMSGDDMDDMDDMDMTDDTMGDDMDEMSDDSMADTSGFAGAADDDMDDMDMTDDTMGDDADGTDDMDGEMQMAPVDQIDLPAGETVALEPGGYHIMLVDVVEPLEDGDEIDVTLTFEQAGETTITVTVGTP